MQYKYIEETGVATGEGGLNDNMNKVLRKERTVLQSEGRMDAGGSFDAN